MGCQVPQRLQFKAPSSDSKTGLTSSSACGGIFTPAAALEEGHPGRELRGLSDLPSAILCPQMPSKTRAGPGRSQEPGIQSSSPVWGAGAGTHLFEPSLLSPRIYIS